MVRKPSHGNADAAAEAAKERKGLWSPEEDDRLYTHITRCGVSTWSSVAQLAGLRRSGKSCRLRWMNYLRPDLKKEPISEREEETIISLQKLLGNRWSVIAAKMPGRTDNEIKNYWNSRIRKRQTAAAAAGRGAGRGDSEPAASAGEEERVNAPPPAAPAPLLPAVFACQLLDGSGANPTTTASTQTSPAATTTQLMNAAGSESEVSVGELDSREEYYYYSAGGGGGVDGADMFHRLLALDDDLEYTPADLLIDVDAWESELYRSN